MHLRIFWFIVSAVALTGGGCASSPSVAQQEQSSASIRAAQEVGAQQVPAASLYLQLAEEQFQAAQHEKDDKDKASRLLSRSQADAELALALARSETERAQAQNALTKVNQLNASSGAVQ